MKKQMIAFFKGFKYAYNGIKVTILQERNFRFHLVIAFYVYLFSAFYNFSKIEYVIITMLIGGVLALELVNSAIERCVAKPDKAHDGYAGLAKDMAAGGVLVFAIASAVCGVILFFDIAILQNILQFYKTNLVALAILALTIILNIFFVFKINKKDEV